LGAIQLPSVMDLARDDMKMAAENISADWLNNFNCSFS